MGSIQFARIASLLRGVDLERTGSGVASVANVRHTLGTRWALAATAGDAGKALAMVWLASRLGGADWASFVAVCVMIGHNWPVLANFNGGRGMLAALGAAAVLIPLQLILLAAILVPIALKFKDTAPSSLAGLLLFPITAVLFGAPPSVVQAFVAIAVISIVRRVTAPPRGRLTLPTVLTKLIFDRPDRRKHWTLEGESR